VSADRCAANNISDTELCIDGRDGIGARHGDSGAPAVVESVIGYRERYSRELPAESVEFERRDDADDVGKFGEASSVAGREYLPVLDVGYASLNGGS
jgi:hypothetical protein